MDECRGAAGALRHGLIVNWLRRPGRGVCIGDEGVDDGGDGGGAFAVGELVEVGATGLKLG